MVNLPELVVTYAQWFSYTREFLSENVELMQAVTTTRQLSPDRWLCCVADSGLDDQKLFAHIRQTSATFISRGQHENRLVDESYGDWGDVFSDTVWASALLDRLLHHSLTVNSRGSWYRLKDKLKGIAPSASKA